MRVQRINSNSNVEGELCLTVEQTIKQFFVSLLILIKFGDDSE